jgi:quercetin dioxygenase-like cupin family protein
VKLLSTCAFFCVLAVTSFFAKPAGAPVSNASTKSDAQLSGKGPAEHFTGTVHVKPLFGAMAPSPMAGASVTFEPGARTAWHTHPMGQVLIVTAGAGWVQVGDNPVETVRPGDVVHIPPGVKHWHGATATTSMTHVAIVEQLDGKTVDWLGPVSDEQYQGRQP